MHPYLLWEPAFQSDILGNKDSFGNIEWTYLQLCENLYDPLVKSFPNYVSRVHIGQDSSGTIPLYAYEFTPPHPVRTAYLQSGVHCIETEGYFGLALLMHHIAHGTDERLRALREQVRFLVVPVVSVYGVTHKGSYENIMSDRRYEISCNAIGGNPNRDFSRQQYAETRHVRAYFEAHHKELSFAFDCHTTTMRDWNAYLLPYPDGLPHPFADALADTNRRLYEKNRPHCPLAFIGEDKDYPTGPITGSFSGGFWQEYGVPASTLEHSDYVFDSVLGTGICMTRALELFGNHVLRAAEL